MFSEILKELRTKKGMSQKQLAEQIGVSTGNVGDWEIGRSKPGYSSLVMLCRVFEVDPYYLLELPPLVNMGGFLPEDLSEDEMTIMAMFRALDERYREDIFDYVKMKYDKQTGGKPLSFTTLTHKAEEPPRIPFAASGWANITPEADSMIQEKLRQFEKRTLELKGKI